MCTDTHVSQCDLFFLFKKVKPEFLPGVFPVGVEEKRGLIFRGDSGSLMDPLWQLLGDGMKVMSGEETDKK